MPTPDLARIQRRTVSGRWKMLLILLACAAPVIASYFTYSVIRPSGRSVYGTLVQPTRGMPVDLPLRRVLPDGGTATEAVDPASLRKQWLLVMVAGGACPADCEEQLYRQRQLREMLGRERDRLDKVWLIPDDDPVRADVLQSLQVAEPVTVLRTEAAALAAWLQAAPGQALGDHLYVIDPMGEWMMRFPPRPEPAKVKRDLDRLMRASASWDSAGR
jgi:hypothetical protein